MKKENRKRRKKLKTIKIHNSASARSSNSAVLDVSTCTMFGDWKERNRCVLVC